MTSDRIWLENEVGIALRDSYSVNEGHCLVVPRANVASLFELSASDQATLWRLANETTSRLKEQFHPDGFNIDVNNGHAAGQTVIRRLRSICR